MEKKTEIPGIYKVEEGILINKDNDSLAAYRAKKLREKKIDALQEDIQNLKGDIDEIKILMRKLVNS